MRATFKCTCKRFAYDYEDATDARRGRCRFNPKTGLKIFPHTVFGTFGNPKEHCPECGKRVLGHWVVAEQTDHECDDDCLYAHGTKCYCKCGGANHGMMILV